MKPTKWLMEHTHEVLKDEPDMLRGWYWDDETGCLHGPCSTRSAAMLALFSYVTELEDTGEDLDLVTTRWDAIRLICLEWVDANLSLLAWDIRQASAFKVLSFSTMWEMYIDLKGEA